MHRTPDRPLSAHLSSTRVNALALAVALGLVASAGAQAQSLRELYDATRGYDAAYLAARAQFDSAQYKAAQVNALKLPTVNVTAGASRTDYNLPDTGSNLLDATSLQAGVQARQSLFNKANSATVAQAQRSLEVAQADLEVADQDLIVRITQAYFDVLDSTDTLATANAGRAAIGEQLASAKRNFEVGTATITDTREAQARYDLAGSTVISAENDLLIKRIALDKLVGRSGVTPLPLAQPVRVPAVLPADVEQWVNLADADHPLNKKSRVAFDIAKLETEKAQAGNLPTVDLFASISGNNLSGTYIRSTGSKTGTINNGQIGVQLNYPLFAGYAIENRIKETVVLEEKARYDVEAVRRTIAQATRVAYFSTQSLNAQVAALEAAESSSKLALEATQLGYKVGVRVNIDVLNAQTQLYQTQNNLSKARYDSLLMRLRLRQASGQLKPEDLNTVDALVRR